MYWLLYFGSGGNSVPKKLLSERQDLGKPSFKKSAVFFNIVQKAFAPPPFLFEHYVVNLSEGISTKVRKRLSRQ